MTNLKNLLRKKNPTGEEVGRALICHAVACLQNAKQHGCASPSAEGIFTDAELNAMVGALSTSADIEIYNGYCEALKTIRHLLTKLELAQSEYESAAWQVIYILSNCLQAETNNRLKSKSPLIVTPEQFAHELKKERAAQDGYMISFAEIAKDVICRAHSEYGDNPAGFDRKNPFKTEFDRMSKANVSKEKQREYENIYSCTEWYETPRGMRSDRVTHEEWTAETDRLPLLNRDFTPSSRHPYDPDIVRRELAKIKNGELDPPAPDYILDMVLFKAGRDVYHNDKPMTEFEYAHMLYNMKFQNDDEILTLTRDFKSLSEIAVRYMNDFGIFDHKIENTPSSLKEKIPMSYFKLKETDFLGYADRLKLDQPRKFRHFPPGFAVLGVKRDVQNASSPADVFMISPESPAFKSIAPRIEKLKQEYDRARAIIQFLLLLAENIRIPELVGIIGKINTGPADHINALSDNIRRNIIRYGEYMSRDRDATAAALAQFELVFRRIYFNSAEPADSLKKAVDEILHPYSELYDRQEAIISILEEGGRRKRGSK